MTEHIKQQIKEEYEHIISDNMRARFTESASWGYSLAEQEIEKLNSSLEYERAAVKTLLGGVKLQEQEITRLKELIKEAVTYGMMEAGCGTTLTYHQGYEEFKQIHKI